MYIYIREHDQARAYVVYSSPVTHACRGDMQAWAHIKKKKQKNNKNKKKTDDQYFFVTFILA